MRPALPISLYVTGRTVVLIGDGRGADERARRLERARARVRRIPIADWDPDNPGALMDAFVVIAHTEDRALNRQIATAARDAGCLCYAHDDPGASDFAMPALARRGPLTLAIATDGTAPALARRLRAQVQAMLDGAGEALDRLLDRMATQRARLPRNLPYAERRRRMSELAAGVELRGSLDVSKPSNR